MSKGEGLYPAPTHKSIKELDAQLISIQKSTRASIPALIPLHDILRHKFNWYYKWSMLGPSKVVHSLILFIYVAGAVFVGYNYIHNITTAKAATSTIVASYTLPSSSTTNRVSYGTNTINNPPTPTASIGTEGTQSNLNALTSAEGTSWSTTGNFGYKIYRFYVTTTGITGYTGGSKGYAYNSKDGSETYKLMIWNFNSSAWETLASGTPASLTSFSGNNANAVSYYKDANNYVYLATFNASSASGTTTLYDDYTYLTVTYTAGSPPIAASGVTIDTAAANGMTAHWTDNSSDETGFKVETAPAASPCSAATPWTLATTTAANATSYAISTLSPNVQYCAEVIATNGGGDASAAYSASALYTLANTPTAPTVTVVSGTSLKVVVNVNSNPAATTFAIYETSTGDYVQADGTLGVSAVYQTYSSWGGASGVTNTGLTTNTTYTYEVKAQNGASVATAFGATATGTPSNTTTATYKSTTTGSKGWITTGSVLTTTPVAESFGWTVASSTNNTQASANDASYISQDFSSGTGIDQPAIIYRYTVSDSSISQYVAEAVGYSNDNDNGGTNFSLWIWNNNTSAWNQLGSTYTGASKCTAGTNCPKATLTTNLSYYKNGSNYVYLQVRGDQSSGNDNGDNMSYLDYLYLTDTYSAGSAPIAPSGVTVDTATTTGVTAHWTDNSSDETGFKVYVSTVPNATCSAATYPGSPNYTAAANATSQAITGLSVNSQYCAKITSTNANGDSTAAYSTAPLYTLANVPTAPTVTATSSSSLTVVVNVNSNPAATTFAIYETSTGNYIQANGTLGASPVYQTYSVWGSGTGVINTGLTASTTYTYEVKAANGDSVATAYSSTASGTTPAAPPTAPSGVTIDTATATGITAHWTDNSSNETGFKVYISTAAATPCSGATYPGSPNYTTAANAISQDATSLSVNTQYCAKVTATSAAGDSTAAYSSSALYTLANTPTAPTVGSASGTTLTVTINQNSNPSNTTYAIYETSTGNYIQANGTLGVSAVWQNYATWGAGSGVINTGLTMNTQYTYEVKAQNGDSIATSFGTTASLTTSSSSIYTTLSSGRKAWYSNGAITPIPEPVTGEATAQQYTDASTANTTYWSTSYYNNSGTPTHMYRFTVTDSSIPQYAAQSVGYGVNGAGSYKLYIWNFNSSAWEQLGSTYTGTSVCTLDSNCPRGTLSNNLSYYKNASNYVYLETVGAASGDHSTGYLYDDYVYLTVEPAAPSAPTAPSAASVDTATATGMTAHWTDNSSDETGFKVYVSTVSNANCSLATYPDSPNYTTAAGVTSQAISSLSVNSQYCAKVTSYNGVGDSAAAYSASPLYTLANTPTAPTVNTPAASSLKVTINQNSNPSNTTYAIYETSTSKYIQANGTLDTSAVWQSYSTWGGASGISNTGLTDSTQYTYEVKASNGDSAATGYGPTASATTTGATCTWVSGAVWSTATWDCGHTPGAPGHTNDTVITGGPVALDVDITISGLTLGDLTQNSGTHLTVNGNVSLSNGLWNINTATATVNGNIDLYTTFHDADSAVNVTTGNLTLNGIVSESYGGSRGSSSININGSGQIHMEGTWGPVSSGHTIPNLYCGSGGTFYYDGTSAQTVVPDNYTSTSVYDNLVINNSAGVSLLGTTTTSGNLTITSGTLNAANAAYALNVGGNWSNSGTYAAAGNTVTFTGAVTHTISGATTFNNLTDTTAGSTLSFQKATTGSPVITIASTMTVTGSQGNNININSDTNASQWLVHFNADQASVTYATIKDSGCGVGSLTETLGTDSTNSGNNGTCWYFAPPAAPTGVTLDTATATGMTAHWTDNSSNESGFKVYVSTVANADCSLATYPGSPNYTTATNAISQAISGLSVNSQYCAKIVATNTNGDSTAAYSASPLYTLANTPSAPTANTPTTSSLKVTINENSNPSNATYAIYETSTSKYIQANGTLNTSAVWQSYSTWGGASGIVNTGLTSSTQYTYEVKASNGDSVATGFGPTASATTSTTAPTAPSGVTIDTPTTTGVTVHWTDNSSNETGFKVYTGAAASPCSSASYTLFTTTAANATSQAVTGLSINAQYCAEVIATNSGTDSSAAYSASPLYTLANIPLAPTVNATSTTSLTVIIDQNSNPSNTAYAIYESSTNKYIQADGTLNTSAVWQTYAQWGGVSGIVNTGLSVNTQYTYSVQAKNGDAVVTSTSTNTDIDTTTGSKAWKSPDTDGQDGLAGAAEPPSSYTEATAPQYTAASTNNASYWQTDVQHSGGSHTNQPSQIYRFTVTDGSISQYKGEVKGYGADSSTSSSLSLYIWNFHSNAWEQLGSTYTGATTCTLASNCPVGTKTTNPSYYKNGSNYVYLGVIGSTTMEDGGDTASLYTDYIYLTDTFNYPAAKYTLANTPSAPTVNTPTISSLKVTVNQNGNPSNTTYAIYETTTGKYIQGGGTLDTSAVWQTYSQWGGASGIVNTGLTSNTQYTYEVKAKNGDNVETAYSSTASATTTANAPTAPSGASLTVDSAIQETFHWKDNSTGETGFKVYISSTANANCSLATYPGSPSYTTAANATTQAATSLSINTQYCAKVTSYNGDGESAPAYAFAPKYTSANIPGTPTVNVTSTTSLTVIINQNSNPSNTTYAIYESSTNKYIQADGTLNTTAIWQDYTTWGGGSGIVNTGLSVNTQYTYEVKARNGDNVPAASTITSYIDTTTGGKAWQNNGEVSSLPAAAEPPSNTIEATSPQYTAASTLDNSNWQTTAPNSSGSHQNIPVQIYRFTVTDTNVNQYLGEVVGYGNDPSTASSLGLYIWNSNSSSWEQLGSTYTGSSSCSLGSNCPVGTKTTNPSYYKNGSNYVYLGVIGPQTQEDQSDQSFLYTDYVYLTVSSGAVNTAAKYTLANAPSAPTVNATSSTSLTTIINQNSNPSNTTYAIYETTTGQYVQANGSLGASAVWQTYSQWGSGTGTVNTGLSVNTQYTYEVKAQNGDSVATSYSGTASKYTLANTPTAPTVNTPTSSSLKVIVNENSNPSSVTYAIYETSTSQYIQANGTLGASAVWQTYTNWGGASGIVNSGLTTGTQYTYEVKAENGDSVATSFGPTASGTTSTAAPTAPSSVTIDTPSTTGLTVHWTDNSSNETGFKVYTGAAASPCSSASYSLFTTTAANATSQAVTGLSVNTQYCAEVIATNSGTDSSAAYSASPLYTLANAPLAPTIAPYLVGGVDEGVIVTINPNSNPSNTTYEMYDTVTGLYAAYDKQCAISPDVNVALASAGSAQWYTYTQWGGASGFTFPSNSCLATGPNGHYNLEIIAQNGDGVTATSPATSYYRYANTPFAPTVNATSTTSLTAIINQNGNPSTVQYAIYETSTSRYIQANGTLGASPVWQDYATWGGVSGIVNTGLSVNTQYAYEVKAQNGDNVATSFSGTASKYTLANTPTAPTVNTPTTSSLKVIINQNSNPSNTTYAIYETSTSQYVQGGGTLGAGAVWQTYTNWGGASGIVNSGLTTGTQYTYEAKAKNTDNAETGYGPTASLTTTGDTISGTIYGTDEVTAVTSQPLVRVKVNGAGDYSVTANGSGVYNIDLGTMPAAGSALTVYLDTNGGITASTFTVSTGVTMTNINLYQNAATTRCDNTCSLTDANINNWAKANDSDIHATVASSNLTVDNDWKLIVIANTFAPGGTVTTTAGGTYGGIEIKSGATLNMASNALSIGGSFTNAGTFTPGTQTTTFKATASGKTITTNNNPFSTLTFNGSGGGWTLQDNLTASALTITTGMLTDNAKNVTVNGSISIANALNLLTSTGIWTQGASGDLSNPAGGNSFYKLTIAGTGVTTTLTGDINIGFGIAGAGTLTMGPGILNGGNKSIFDYPHNNNDIVTSSLQAGTSLNTLWIMPQASVTQNAFTLPNSLINTWAIISTANYSWTATGDWNFGNNTLAVHQSSGTPTKYIDMSSSALTCGTLYIGDSYAGATSGYVKMGTSTSHSIGSISKGTSAGTSNILDMSATSPQPPTVAVSGNMDFTGITVTQGSSTINLTGAVTHNISGTATLNNLSDSVAGSTLNFQKQTAGSPVLTIAGTLTVTGTVGSHINIKSSTTDTQWLAHFNANQSAVTYATIKDSGCDAGTSTETLGSDSTNSGNNGTCWHWPVTPNTPGAPTVNATSASSNTIIIDQNSNTSDTTYEIYETTTSQYVQANGTLDASAVWQTYTNWGGAGGIVNTGLSVNAQYTYEVKAKSADNIQSAFSGTTSRYTLANTPLTPVVNTPTTSSLKVTINQNSNPSNTTYAIYETSTSNYVQADGSLNTSAVWQTYTNWGGASGIVNTGLTNATQYTYEVKASNGDNTATSYGPTASATTLTQGPSAPTGVTLDTPTTSGLTVHWTDTSSNETGFKVYISSIVNADCSQATYPGTPDYTPSANAVTQAATGLNLNTQYCAKVIATNIGGDSDSAYSTSPLYTLANVPSAPTVSAVSSTSLNTVINQNSNPSNTLYSIANTSGKYIQADGTLGDNAVWQDYVTWGGASGVINTGLSVNTQYTYGVYAKNGDGTLTIESNGASKYTLANTPTALTVAAVSTALETVTVNQNGNPSSTTYAIYETSTGDYVQADGTLGALAVFQTYSNWGSASGTGITGLSANTNYTYEVQAKNSNSVATGSSPTASRYTLVQTPSGITFGTVTDNSIAMIASGSISNLNAGSSGLYFNETSGNSGADGVPDGFNTWTKTNSVTDTGLALGTQYSYRVMARNGDGVETVYTTAANQTTTQSGLTAPSGVTLTSPSTTGLTVNWADNSSSETGFKVYISTTANANCNQATYSDTPTYVTAANATSQVASGLSISTQYCAKVTATTGSLDSAPAYSAPKYTLANAPLAPTINATSSTSLTAIINQNSNSLTTVYAIHETISNKYIQSNGSLSPTLTWKTYSAWGSDSGIVNTGLSVNTQYTYDVVARNGDNAETAYSGTASKYTLANNPGALAVSANYNEVNSYYTQMTVGANSNPNATEYKILYGQTINHITSEMQDWTSHNNNDTVYHTNLPDGLSCDQHYYYSITSRNHDNVSAGEQIGWAETPPCAPDGLDATDLTAASANLTWDGVSGPVPTYVVSLGTDTSATNIGLQSGVSGLSLAVSSLNQDTTFYFKVRATNTNGTGAYSTISSFATIVSAANKLLIKLPGQNYTSGSGISGSPTNQVAGTPFSATVYATDNNNTLLGSHNEPIALSTPTDTSASCTSCTQNASNLSGGSKTVTLVYYKTGSNNIINATGSSGSSSPFNVVAGPTSAGLSTVTPLSATLYTGQTQTFSIHLRDIYGNDVAGHHVNVSTNQLGDITISSGSTTSSDGTINIGLTSGLAHVSTVTVTDTDASVSLSAHPVITFITEPTRSYTIDNPTNFTGTAGDKVTHLLWVNPNNPYYDHTEVYRSTSEGTLGNKISDVAGVSYSDSGLMNGTAYYYTLKAVDSFNDVSTGTYQLPLTPFASIPPDYYLNAPSNLRATDIGSTTISLAWDAARGTLGVTGYKLYNAVTNIQIAATVDANIDLTDLTPGTDYKFIVRAYDVTGNNSDPSNVLTITTDNTDEPVIQNNVYLILANVPSEITAGQKFQNQVKVMATDGGGAITSTYTGSVYFTSSDNQADLEWDRVNVYTFGRLDSGSHQFDGDGFALNTSGKQVLSVTDGRALAKAEIQVNSTVSSIVFQKAQDQVSNFVGSNANKVNNTALLTTAAVLLAPIFVNILLGLVNIIPQLIFWFLQLLQLLGARKRRKSWGVVFNSQTGQPISLVIVRLYSKEYNRLIETAVSDNEGRFGFLAKPGNYHIVAQKAGFIFPSQYKVSSFYNDVYASGNIEINQKDIGSITHNIPMDPETKVSAIFGLWVFIIKLSRFLQKIRIPLLIIGSVFAVIMIIESYNIIYVLSLGLYLLLFALEYLLSKRAKTYGLVTDVFEHPLETAIVRIYNKKTNRLISTDVSDDQGRYQFLVSPGIYYMTAAKPEYTDYKSYVIYLEKEKLMVTRNVKLKKVEKDSK